MWHILTAAAVAAIVVGSLGYLRWKRPHSTRLGRTPAATGAGSPIAGWAARMIKKKWVWIPLVIFAVWILVQNVYWVKYTGWDPSTLWASKSESAIYEFKSTKKQLEDQARAKVIEAATEKLRSGEKLSPAEMQELEEATLSPKASPPSRLSSPIRYGVCDGSTFAVPEGGRTQIELGARNAGKRAAITGTYRFRTVSLYGNGSTCAWPGPCPSEGLRGIEVQNLEPKGDITVSCSLSAG